MNESMLNEYKYLFRRHFWLVGQICSETQVAIREPGISNVVLESYTGSFLSKMGISPFLLQLVLDGFVQPKSLEY